MEDKLLNRLNTPCKSKRSFQDWNFSASFRTPAGKCGVTYRTIAALFTFAREVQKIFVYERAENRVSVVEKLEIVETIATRRDRPGTALKSSRAVLFPQKTNIQQLKEEIQEKLPETTTDGGTSISGTNLAATGTLRHRKNRPAPQPPQRPSSHNGAISAPEQLEIRAPSELLFGVPSTLKTQWRHQPKTLVTGCVTYVANVSAFCSHIAFLSPCIYEQAPRTFVLFKFLIL